nr:MAG TPA: Tail tape measure [Caudoviricetes sp.]
MATLQNYISLRDGVSPMLEKMSRAAHTVSNKLNRASGSARNAGDSFGYAAGKAGLFKSILAGNIIGNVIMRGLDSIAGSISGAVALADEYTSLNARLALVAGSQSNVAALNDMIYESAQRARGGYMDMAKAVASLSVNARDAFPDPRKTVQFMEGMQKLFVIGGASKENQQFAMLQLQQSLASGRLQGDEFRSITENAPILQDMIAKTMKVSRGELKQLSAQGEITADIIKRAIFENMDEINDKFESMPKRWSDHFTDFKNVVLKSFAPIADRINRLANSEGVRSMFSMLKNGIKSIMPVLYAVIGGVEKFVNMFTAGISTVASFVQNHSLLMQMALIALGGYLAFVGTMALISAGQMALAAISMAAKTAADWLETVALIALTVAQEGLNAALYACPLTWIVGAIIAVIAVLYAAVAAVNYFAGMSISATGIIFGAFMLLFSSIWNMIAFTVNMFVSLAEFIGNVFVDPLNATYNLFADIWNGVVDLVGQAVAAIVDMIAQIPGMNKLGISTDFTAESMRMERREISGGYDYSGLKMKTLDYSNEMAWGYNVGAGIGDSISGALQMPEIEAPGYNAKDIVDNTANTADNTGKGAKDAKRAADALDSTADDLAFLREAAEREAINKYTTATIHIDVGGVTAGDTGGNDFDGVLRRLNDVLIESVENGAEAVQR